MLGENIKFLRKQYNFTIRELADNLGLNYSTLGMYETERREPNNEILCKIADYFDVTTDMLLNRKELELHVKADYIKIIKKAELLKITAEELDSLLDMAIKMKGKV